MVNKSYDDSHDVFGHGSSLPSWLDSVPTSSGEKRPSTGGSGSSSHGTIHASELAADLTSASVEAHGAGINSVNDSVGVAGAASDAVAFHTVPDVLRTGDLQTSSFAAAAMTVTACGADKTTTTRASLNSVTSNMPGTPSDADVSAAELDSMGGQRATHRPQSFSATGAATTYHCPRSSILPVVGDAVPVMEDPPTSTTSARVLMTLATPKPSKPQLHDRRSQISTHDQDELTQELMSGLPLGTS